MEITQEMQEVMILSLLRHDKTPQGVECSFFQFGTVGVKFYGYCNDSKHKAIEAFHMQSRCYAKGLAPKPGQVFSVPIKGAGIYGSPMALHGYTTEIAVMVDNPSHGDRSKLREALSVANLPHGDLHSGNVGYIIENDTFKLVPIDFGSHFVNLS